MYFSKFCFLKISSDNKLFISEAAINFYIVKLFLITETSNKIIKCLTFFPDILHFN